MNIGRVALASLIVGVPAALGFAMTAGGAFSGGGDVSSREFALIGVGTAAGVGTGVAVAKLAGIAGISDGSTVSKMGMAGLFGGAALGAALTYARNHD